ncbi:cupin domain-containing protein [Pseudomaricurvus sp. HS19]|uniref:cupin domain-containing protein n=1 Tax=Pseudomaricurvus sp. HS19 TaxID=2692626 RepID=UPI00136F2B8A|nr:cupin domain-containing protein [Pseudomaricurvus sp. HS19]
MDVGYRLREVRKSAGLSQRELAKRAGVTNSTISMIEKNSVSPSVSSLKKVLSGIPMSLMEFFGSEDSAELETPVVYSADEFKDATVGDIDWKLIGQAFPNRAMSFMVETMPPGSDTGEGMYMHDGEEVGYVVTGKLELTVDDQIYVVEAGQGYYFDSRKEHRFRNPFDEECKLVSCTTPANF